MIKEYLSKKKIRKIYKKNIWYKHPKEDDSYMRWKSI